MKIRDKAVLITGAGRGLGRALALELAKNGARLVLVARNEREIHDVAREARALGATAHAIAADVGELSRAPAIAARAAELVGPIEVLVQNASTLGPTPLLPLEETTPQHLADVFDVNLFGPFALAKAVIGSMVLRGEGLVLHLSSDAAVEAYPRWGAYSASKAALDHLSRIWAAELAESGVRFIGVDPGEMNTKMHADAIPEADPRTLADPADVARTIGAIIEGAENVASGSRLIAAKWGGRS